MDWATTVGLGGISLAVIGLVIGLLKLANDAVASGATANDCRRSQLEAEFITKNVTRERDELTAALAKAFGERQDALNAVQVARDAATTAMNKLRLSLKEHVDAATAEDLVGLSLDVMGLRSPKPVVSTTSQAGDTTSGGSSEGSGTVSGTVGS